MNQPKKPYKCSSAYLPIHSNNPNKTRQYVTLEWRFIDDEVPKLQKRDSTVLKDVEDKLKNNRHLLALPKISNEEERRIRQIIRSNNFASSEDEVTNSTDTDEEDTSKPATIWRDTSQMRVAEDLPDEFREAITNYLFTPDELKARYIACDELNGKVTHKSPLLEKMRKKKSRFPLITTARHIQELEKLQKSDKRSKYRNDEKEWRLSTKLVNEQLETIPTLAISKKYKKFYSERYAEKELPHFLEKVRAAGPSPSISNNK